MAVIDELVAIFGFDVQGLDKVKKAVRTFLGFKKEVVASANPLKQAAGGGTIAALAIGKVGSEAKKSSRSVLLMSTALGRIKGAGAVAVAALRTILLVAVRLVAVFAGLATGALAVAAGFAMIGVRAALARREMRLAAAEIGTTAQNLETVGNILRGVGFGDGFQDEAKKIIGALDEVAKTVRKGGDEAEEAKKKFKGFGIDNVFDVDPKTGKSRDSAALALDTLNAYKAATDQAAKLRKEADTTKSAKKAAALRKKAIEQDRKNAEFADAAGISGRLKVLLDGLTGKQFAAVANEISRLFPTTSNKEEGKRAEVADQAVQAGLKFDALMAGLSERFKEIGTSLAGTFLPGLNSFLDSVISFAKRTGIIKETVGERAARTEMEREANRAKGFGGTPEETAQQRRNRTQSEALQKGLEEDRKRYGTPTTAPLPPRRTDVAQAGASIDNLVSWLKSYVSPETNATKMQKAAENKVENDQRKYENIGNDQRTISPSITVNATGLDAVAAAVKNSVLGAISTKGSNTSTGALTAP